MSVSVLRSTKIHQDVLASSLTSQTSIRLLSKSMCSCFTPKDCSEEVQLEKLQLKKDHTKGVPEAAGYRTAVQHSHTIIFVGRPRMRCTALGC
jgi:hypothetical protein